MPFTCYVCGSSEEEKRSMADMYQIVKDATGKLRIGRVIQTNPDGSVISERDANGEVIAQALDAITDYIRQLEATVSDLRARLEAANRNPVDESGE